MRTHLFYGWWIVVACMLATLVGNAIGLFGASVYLHVVVAANGWATGDVSGAVTLFYVVSALLLIPVGSGIHRFGPRAVIGFCGIAMAGGVVAIGRAAVLWQVYLAFLLMGIGWAGLSTTAVATTLAPWFEKYQGRAMSIASLGVSAGGMIGAPMLLFGIDQIGFAATTTAAGLFAAAILLPLAGLVLRRRPEDLGLFPDGLAPAGTAAPTGVATSSRLAAMRTTALRTVVIGFGLAMMIQVGFLTHQINLLAQFLGSWGVSVTVSATALAALLGRLVLARFADQIDVRMTVAIVLLVAAASLAAMGLRPGPTMLVGLNVIFGLTVGNVTTIAPIVVRREFGAAGFGAVFGVASCCVQLVAALGPSFYGLLRDAFGSYDAALLLAAVLDVTAAAVVVLGRPKAPARSAASPPRRG